jgi:hypothetical protein
LKTTRGAWRRRASTAKIEALNQFLTDDHPGDGDVQGDAGGGFGAEGEHSGDCAAGERAGEAAEHYRDSGKDSEAGDSDPAVELKELFARKPGKAQVRFKLEKPRDFIAMMDVPVRGAAGPGVQGRD